MALDQMFTRRDLLKGAAGLTGGVILSGSVLSACGGTDSDQETPAAAASSSAPKKGGHILSGVSGGSTKDELDAHTAYRTVPQIGMQWQLYDALLGFDPEHKMIYLLAESYEPSADAVVHTVRLKPDLVFHNGKTVTADDVVFSYKRILDPKTVAAGSDLLRDLSPSGIKKVDDLTVQFTLDKPNAIFWESLAFFCNAIVPVGYKPNVGEGLIGTGPWVMQDYVPGEKAEFTANADYWGEGPYADQLSMIQYVDPTARLNALLDGTVDHVELLEAAQTKVVEGTADLVLLESKSGGWKPFTMRIDKKPYSDVRVRQAMRLIVNRDEMIEQALGGYAWLGNDMYAPFDPGYPKDLPQREQDLEQAKSLLSQAGYEGLSIEVVTSEAVGSGMVAAAQVFAEQAKGAGVTVKVNKVNPDIFYGDDYLNWDFAQDYWGTRNYLAQTVLSTTPTSPYNECRWQDDEWQKIIDEAFVTVDEAKRNELVSAASQIEYERGGYIVWQNNILLDAYRNTLGGVIADSWGQSACKNRYNLMYFK